MTVNCEQIKKMVSIFLFRARKVLLNVIRSKLGFFHRWSCYDDGLPETMKADSIMSLPAEVRFSASKATDMIVTVSKV